GCARRPARSPDAAHPHAAPAAGSRPTPVRPGRPNVLGTVVAVAVLAVGLTGIGQLGADFWTVPLFYGGTLLIAVGLAGYASRRRLRTDTGLPPDPPEPAEGGAA
ncbi:hypothetical protein ABZ372_52975, partial [Streptomyces sp. NPDC005921]